MSVRLLRAIALGLLVGLLVLWWLLPRGIGQLVRKAGTVERDRHQQLEVFLPAEPGASFEVGDGLRTAEAASAEVQLLDGPLLKVRAATLIRFRGGAPGAQRVALSRGEVSIFTVEDPVLFETAAGLVRVSPHSRAVLHEEGNESWVEVILGRAELEWASASRRSLVAGESAHVVHDAPEPPSGRPGETSDPNTAAAARTRPTSSDGGSAPQPGPAWQSGIPDFVVSPAPVITIFDPAPPTQLGFAQGCTQGKVSLEVEQEGKFVDSAPVHAFEQGNTRYRLHCGTRTVATGKVRVVQDAGQRALAEAAPTNVVDADGRAYTVLYQTRLPDLTIRWPSAAPNTRANLLVESGADRRSFPVVGSQASLPSGTLVDGEHKLWFQAEGSDLRSRTTRLEIRFDNATPLARLNQPGNLVANMGAATLSGVVVTGARVSIRGKRVALDGSGRFTSIVTAREGERGVAVMVELPHRSVVYYVRRFQAAHATP